VQVALINGLGTGQYGSIPTSSDHHGQAISSNAMIIETKSSFSSFCDRYIRKMSPEHILSTASTEKSTTSVTSSQNKMKIIPWPCFRNEKRLTTHPVLVARISNSIDTQLHKECHHYFLKRDNHNLNSDDNKKKKGKENDTSNNDANDDGGGDIVDKEEENRMITYAYSFEFWKHAESLPISELSQFLLSIFMSCLYRGGGGGSRGANDTSVEDSNSLPVTLTSLNSTFISTNMNSARVDPIAKSAWHLQQKKKKQKKNFSSLSKPLPPAPALVIEVAQQLAVIAFHLKNQQRVINTTSGSSPSPSPSHDAAAASSPSMSYKRTRLLSETRNSHSKGGHSEFGYRLSRSCVYMAADLVVSFWRIASTFASSQLKYNTGYNTSNLHQKLSFQEQTPSEDCEEESSDKFGNDDDGGGDDFGVVAKRLRRGEIELEDHPDDIQEAIQLFSLEKLQQMHRKLLIKIEQSRKQQDVGINDYNSGGVAGGAGNMLASLYDKVSKSNNGEGWMSNSLAQRNFNNNKNVVATNIPVVTGSSEETEAKLTAEKLIQKVDLIEKIKQHVTAYQYERFKLNDVAKEQESMVLMNVNTGTHIESATELNKKKKKNNNNNGNEMPLDDDDDDEQIKGTTTQSKKKKEGSNRKRHHHHHHKKEDSLVDEFGDELASIPLPVICNQSPTHASESNNNNNNNNNNNIENGDDDDDVVVVSNIENKRESKRRLDKNKEQRPPIIDEDVPSTQQQQQQHDVTLDFSMAMDELMQETTRASVELGSPLPFKQYEGVNQSSLLLNKNTGFNNNNNNNNGTQGRGGRGRGYSTMNSGETGESFDFNQHDDDKHLPSPLSPLNLKDLNKCTIDQLNRSLNELSVTRDGDDDDNEGDDDNEDDNELGDAMMELVFEAAEASRLLNIEDFRSELSGQDPQEENGAMVNLDVAPISKTAAGVGEKFDDID
jgi:hypothetical protein